jgi:hypothetical protein
MTDFMEIIFIQLTNKTRKVTVLEMLRKDMFRKFLVLFIAQLAEDLMKANFSNDEGVEYSRIDQGIIVIGVTKRTRVPKKSDVPPRQRSYHLHSPTAQHSHLMGSPTSYIITITWSAFYRFTGGLNGRMRKEYSAGKGVLVEFANLHANDNR